MALKFWINESGKICLRDGKILLCETSPCEGDSGVPRSCCDGENWPSFMYISASVDGNPVEIEMAFQPGLSNEDLGVFIGEGSDGCDPSSTIEFSCGLSCNSETDQLSAVASHGVDGFTFTGGADTIEGCAPIIFNLDDEAVGCMLFEGVTLHE